MNDVDLTHHAQIRTSQRGIRESDLDLLILIGTPVNDGFLARHKDCETLERQCKQLIERIHRLRGKRVVVAEGRVITAYRVNRRKARNLLRSAHECEFEDAG
jgi:hypothetical protein